MKRTQIIRKTPLQAKTALRAKTPMRKRARASTKARQSARGRTCKVRLPGCDGGGDTTVSAHYRLAGYCGTGLKPPDSMAAFACGPCHDACDGRRTIEGYTRMEIRLAHAEGCLRTAAELESEAA